MSAHRQRHAQTRGATAAALLALLVLYHVVPVSSNPAKAQTAPQRPLAREPPTRDPRKKPPLSPLFGGSQGSQNAISPAKGKGALLLPGSPACSSLPRARRRRTSSASRSAAVPQCFQLTCPLAVAF